MKTSTFKIISKSLKFSFIVVGITAFFIFLAAPTIFGVVLITPSLIAIVLGYGFLALLAGLVFNTIKTFFSANKKV